MVFTKANIPAKLSFTERAPVEDLFTELKRLLPCPYNPNKYNISNDLDALKKSLDLFSANYNEFSILGDFNVEFNKTYIKATCDSYSLKSLATPIIVFKIGL